MSAQARLRYARRSKEADLRRAFEKLDSKGDKKIDADELQAFFKACGQVVSRGEVEDMIWEVDEDLDGALSWKEFQQMYHRCDDGAADFEPRQLFNVIQFIMTDTAGRGYMTLEDAMQILYLRNGRETLDAQLEALFGTSNINSGKEITLREFLDALHGQQVTQLRNSKVDGRSYKAPPLVTARASSKH